MLTLLKELLFKNLKPVLITVAIATAIYFLWSTATSVAVLGEEQKQLSQDVKGLGEQLSQLKVLGEQTRDIQREQMALTKRIGDSYDKDTQAANAYTSNALGAVSDGTFRLRIKKPSVSVTVPYRSVAGPDGVASPGAASSPDATSGSDSSKKNH
jgi:hypothetical protein